MAQHRPSGHANAAGNLGEGGRAFPLFHLRESPDPPDDECPLCSDLPGEAIRNGREWPKLSAEARAGAPGGRICWWAHSPPWMHKKTVWSPLTSAASVEFVCRLWGKGSSAGPNRLGGSTGVGLQRPRGAAWGGLDAWPSGARPPSHAPVAIEASIEQVFYLVKEMSLKDFPMRCCRDSRPPPRLLMPSGPRAHVPAAPTPARPR